jgi:hypothetical protein
VVKISGDIRFIYFKIIFFGGKLDGFRSKFFLHFLYILIT